MEYERKCTKNNTAGQGQKVCLDWRGGKNERHDFLLGKSYRVFDEDKRAANFNTSCLGHVVLRFTQKIFLVNQLVCPGLVFIMKISYTLLTHISNGKIIDFKSCEKRLRENKHNTS